MFKRFLKALRQQIQNIKVDSAQRKVEAKTIPRLEAAVLYNRDNVPVFAPDGFPEFATPYVDKWAHNTEGFAKAVAVVQHLLGIKSDGFCGPATIHAMAVRDRESVGTNSILIGPRAYLMSVPVVTYVDAPELEGIPARTRVHKMRQVVMHYDVTFNSRSTLQVLRRRNLSYHFLIDGDNEATIYQTHNPTTHVCFHAGSANNHSVGVCLNNPADPSYQDRDTQQRGRERPVRIASVHGGHVELLDFFPEQIESANELVPILCDALSIPRKVPRDIRGNPRKEVINADAFDGVLGHYHLTRSKIDPAPLDWEDLSL